MEAPESQLSEPEGGTGEPILAQEAPTFELTNDDFKALGFVEQDGERYAMYYEDEQGNLVSFKTVDDFRDGVREQQRGILSRDRDVADLQKRLNGATQTLTSKERELELFSSRLGDDELIRPYLVEAVGEKLVNKDRDKLTDEEQVKLEAARINAKVEANGDGP